jgi:hypothetical protein
VRQTQQTSRKKEKEQAVHIKLHHGQDLPPSQSWKRAYEAQGSYNGGQTKKKCRSLNTSNRPNNGPCHCELYIWYDTHLCDKLKPTPFRKDEEHSTAGDTSHSVFACYQWADANEAEYNNSNSVRMVTEKELSR